MKHTIRIDTEYLTIVDETTSGFSIDLPVDRCIGCGVWFYKDGWVMLSPAVVKELKQEETRLKIRKMCDIDILNIFEKEVSPHWSCEDTFLSSRRYTFRIDVRKGVSIIPIVDLKVYNTPEQLKVEIKVSDNHGMEKETIRCEGLEESIQCFKETLRDAEADAVIKLKDYLQIK